MPRVLPSAHWKLDRRQSLNHYQGAMINDWRVTDPNGAYHSRLDHHVDHLRAYRQFVRIATQGPHPGPPYALPHVSANNIGLHQCGTCMDVHGRASMSH